MKRLQNLQMIRSIGGILCCGLILSSCNVTGPDSAIWEDVSTFSWPTETGVTMKYRSIDTATSEEQVTVEIADPPPFKEHLNGMYMLKSDDPDLKYDRYVHFLPMQDRLLVEQDKIGTGIALLAPLEKGHRWYTSENENSKFEAEIIERFAYRKVDGKVYQNVVAVRYRKNLDGQSPDEEYIRFYAQGVGEILTVENVYYNTNATSEPLPEVKARRELIETSAAN